MRRWNAKSMASAGAFGIANEHSKTAGAGEAKITG
jgi:hypothetical protein